MRSMYLLLCTFLAAGMRLDAQSTLYFNGNIYTGNGFTDRMLIENGVVQSIGSETETKISANTRIDLQGVTVLPGFVDSHVHFIDGALGMIEGDFTNIIDIDRFLEHLESTRNTLIDGMYVGRNLNFDVVRQFESPRDMLDGIFREIPVFLFLKGGHSAITNSAGLRMLGFSDKTKRSNKTLERDSLRRLNGFLVEDASMQASRYVGSRYSSYTIHKAIIKAQEKYLSYGITTIGDNTFNPFHYKILQQAQIQGQLKLRLWARSYGKISETTDLMSQMGSKKLGVLGKKVDRDRIRFHAIKLFEDMSLSLQSHAVHSAPGGDIYFQKEEIKKLLLLNPEFVFAFHVQGKKGLQQLIDAITEVGDGRRHVIDHAGYASIDQLDQIHELGLAVTMIGSQVFDFESLSRSYNAKGFDQADLLDMKDKYEIDHAALTSDYPYGMDTTFADNPAVDGLDPFSILAINTSGKDPNGSIVEGFESKRLSVEEGIRAYTQNGAFALGEEASLGKLLPGFKADFTIIDRPVFSMDPYQFYNTIVLRTYVDGMLVYDRNETAGTESKHINRISDGDYAISPVLGYSPTIGAIYGAAYFNYPLQTPGHYFDLIFMANGLDQIQLNSTFKYFDLFRNVDFTLSGSYDGFQQYYFGEYNYSDSRDYSILIAKRMQLRPSITYKIDRKNTLQLFVDGRLRSEKAALNDQEEELDTIFFANLRNLGLGCSYRIDTRDNKSITHDGFYAELSATQLKNITMFHAEARFFRYLHDSRFVLASRLSAGYATATPSYINRFTLGGATTLRGYYENRFRGNKYYLGQFEIRYPLYKRFFGSAFTDIGNITDDHFGRVLQTFGFGLHFALRRNISLRLDYGFGKDQNGAFFMFGEAL